MICRCRFPQSDSGKSAFRSRSVCDHVATARESPARRQPVDVRVDRKGRDPEGLHQHDARGLVTDAGQRFEFLEAFAAPARRGARPAAARARGCSSPWRARARRGGSPPRCAPPAAPPSAPACARARRGAARPRSRARRCTAPRAAPRRAACTDPRARAESEAADAADRESPRSSRPSPPASRHRPRQ